VTLGPPFRAGAVPARGRSPVPALTLELQAASVLAAAAASSLQTELWLQNDADGGIRVTLGSQLSPPRTARRSPDRSRTIEGAA
jgi:hypothetical protein